MIKLYTNYLKSSSKNKLLIFSSKPLKNIYAIILLNIEFYLNFL